MKDQKENITQELERMICSAKDCTVEHDLKSYVTVKMLAIIGFAIMSPLVGLSMYILNDAISDVMREIQLQLQPIKEHVKQNELRIVRTENNQSENKKLLVEVAQNTRDIKTDLKYNFITKKQHEQDLKEKVDFERINKQYLNK